MGLKGGLYHKTQINLAYNSNRIEGSRLTEELIKEFHRLIKYNTSDVEKDICMIPVEQHRMFMRVM